ncbi:MAG: hypothetical protein JWM12_1001 [Ilumatobacteraceae bacterium]|nr:hypothetical protein [Ilumatobacteraceae bacterium]
MRAAVGSLGLVADVGKRPFWMHQIVEYILGAALAAVGLQSPTPLMPALAGIAVIMHAAITKAPFSAFRVIGRKLHRVVDIGVIAFEVLAAVQPFVDVESATRGIMIAIAIVHLFVWWQTSYKERVKQPKAERVTLDATGRSGDIGRTAGRLVGSGVNIARKARAKRDNR